MVFFARAFRAQRRASGREDHCVLDMFLSVAIGWLV